MKEYNIKISTALLLVIAYFGIMLFYTFLEVEVWRKIFPDFSNIINIITIAICIYVFIGFLKRDAAYQLQLLSNLNFTGVILAIGCSVLLFLLLDKCLDPIFESIFPQSEQNYQEWCKRYPRSCVVFFWDCFIPKHSDINNYGKAKYFVIVTRGFFRRDGIGIWARRFRIYSTNHRSIAFEDSWCRSIAI